MKSEAKPVALVVDGATLIYAMADPDAKALLLAFTVMCKAVVCCRVSPDQKREIVVSISEELSVLVRSIRDSRM